MAKKMPSSLLGIFPIESRLGLLLHSFQSVFYAFFARAEACQALLNDGRGLSDHRVVTIAATHQSL